MAVKDASECSACEMEVRASFGADCEAIETGDPRESTLDNPAMLYGVAAALDAAAGDARHDAPRSAFLPAAAMIVSLVGAQLVRPPARGDRSGPFVSPIPP